MVRLNWTPRAETDLNNIYNFIAADSKRYAKQQVVQIVEHTKTLRQHIYLGRVVPEIMDNTIRELILGHFRIVYKIISNEQLAY